MFINTYRQATHLEDPQLRMIHTIQTAGKATFFTSLTTAAAYAANVFSQVGGCPVPVLASPFLAYIPGLWSLRFPPAFSSQPFPQALAMSLGSIFVTYQHY